MTSKVYPWYYLDFRNKKLPAVAFGGVCILWIANIFFVYCDNHGTFGDMFGSVNALFSGLAFAGIIYSLIMQRSELKLQRKELRLQREEIRLQREESVKQTQAFGEQTQLLRIDRFETTFFNLFEVIAKSRSNYIHIFRDFINSQTTQKDMALRIEESPQRNEIINHLRLLENAISLVIMYPTERTEFFTMLVADSLNFLEVIVIRGLMKSKLPHHSEYMVFVNHFDIINKERAYQL